jgi:hypothetical protein
MITNVIFSNKTENKLQVAVLRKRFSVQHVLAFIKSNDFHI